jgi:hypothetical protein
MWNPRRLTTLWAFTACYRDRLFFQHMAGAEMKFHARSGHFTLWQDFFYLRTCWTTELDAKIDRCKEPLDAVGPLNAPTTPCQPHVT